MPKVHQPVSTWNQKGMMLRRSYRYKQRQQMKIYNITQWLSKLLHLQENLLFVLLYSSTFRQWWIQNFHEKTNAGESVCFFNSNVKIPWVRIQDFGNTTPTTVRLKFADNVDGHNIIWGQEIIRYFAKIPSFWINKPFLEFCCHWTRFGRNAEWSHWFQARSSIE